MAAHRYWRAVALESSGVDPGLELTEFHLLAGTTRVDAAATLTASLAPVTGALADLKDDNTSTGAAWPTTQGLVLSWDFGSGGDQDVTDIRLGSSSSAALFLFSARMQWSDDNSTWSDLLPVLTGILWPGPRAKTVSASDFTLVYDDFSSNTIANYTVTGDGSATWSITSGALTGVAATTSSQSILTRNGLSFTDGYVEADMTQANDGGLVLRVVGVNSYYLLTIQDASSNVGSTKAVGMYRKTASGTFITIGAIIAGLQMPPRGASFKARFSIAGTTLRAYIDGILVMQVTDSGIVGPGAAGVRSSSPVTSIYESLTYTSSTLVQRILRSTAVTGRAAPRLPGFVYPLTAVPVASFGLSRWARPLQGRQDFLTGDLGRGIGRVKGTTKDKGSPNVPVSERVRLHRQIDGKVIRETLSTPGTGAYSFDYVDELQAYYVVSFDHDLAFRAVIADNLTLAGGGVELIA